MPPNKMPQAQKGNALVIILIGIALFAALVFTFTKTGQKGSGNLTKQQAKVAAQEILNYAKSIEGAVDRIRQRGCSESDINFNNALINGYSNTSAPIDGSCDIFGTNGGKATIQNTQENWTIGNNNWGFNAQFQVSDIGTTCASESCADLVINLENIQTTLCEEINRSLLNDATIPVDSDFDFTAFTGSFSNPTDIADEAGSSSLAGQSTGCFNSTADSSNIFYHVLLAR